MNKPAVVAPVSRFLAVADANRSIAFYRDVLGFEVLKTKHQYRVDTSAELVLGQAHIQIGAGETTFDSTGQRRPRGAAILFFEVDDVAAMRDAVVARGGAPTELEKVNWIKMRMFEIHDPDGHTLWFGQSFQEPDRPRPEAMLEQALPTLPLSNVAAGVKHYCDVLGFSIDYADDKGAVLNRDKVTVLLVARTAKHTGIGACSVYVRDADAFHAELVAKGANVQGEPVSRPWGLRDFRVLDLEGNEITFGQPFE